MLHAMNAAFWFGLGLLVTPSAFAWGDNGFNYDKFPYAIANDGIYNGNAANPSCQIDDKRTAILISNAITVKIEKNKDGKCVVVAGEWRDYYTGSILDSVDVVDYDYIVPLKEVWKSGADKWRAEQRKRFASNHRWIVITRVNIKKDKDEEGIDQWLPDDGYRACKYINSYVAIKLSNSLSFTEDEIDEIDDYHGEKFKDDNGIESLCEISGIYRDGLIFETQRELNIRD